MRTNRTTLAAMLSIALAVLPGAVAAQSADEELETPSYWTGTESAMSSQGVPGGEVAGFPWGYRTTVGVRATSEADDPRASGDLTMVLFYDDAGAYDIARATGLVRLANEGGAFQGPIHVFYYPDGSEFRMALLEGQEGYEGLTLSMTNFLDPSGEGQPQGLIWEGEVPVPDADLLPE